MTSDIPKSNINVIALLIYSQLTQPKTIIFHLLALDRFVKAKWQSAKKKRGDKWGNRKERSAQNQTK